MKPTKKARQSQIAAEPKPPQKVADLARALGVKRQTLEVHVKKTGAPPLDDVDGWRTHLAAFGREGSAPPDWRNKIAEERCGLIREMRLKAHRENQIKSGEVIEFKVVQHFLNDLVGNFFFGEMDRAQNTWPSSLKGRSELEIFQTLKDECNRIKTGLKDRLSLMEREGEKAADGNQAQTL
jgi:hypothetical protein